MIDIFYTSFVKLFIESKIDEGEKFHKSNNDLIKHIKYHQNMMPDFLNLGIKIISTFFLILSPLYKLLRFNNSKFIFIENSRSSKLFIFKNLIRFHDSLFELSNVKENFNTESIKKRFPIDRENYDFIIIGSGPGGSVSAKLLQNSGYKTCILESGYDYPNNTIAQYSYNEILKQYKNGGINVTLGNANITYVEGETLGGGSQINSGLYHRTPKSILKHWEEKYQLKESTVSDLDKYFLKVEKDLIISWFPEEHIPKASLILKDGAEKLGWKVQEVPRWFSYDSLKSSKGMKMTMKRTYLKSYIKNGGIIYNNTKAKKIKKVKKKWILFTDTPKGQKKFSSKNLIISAGTINTPTLLKRSKLINKRINQFQMHPTVKIVALFKDKINSSKMGVPVHQVKEFAPDFSFGCSISSKPYLKVAMLDHYKNKDLVEDNWEKMAIYYVMIVPEGRGKINNLPYFNDPLVRYNLTNKDKKNLSLGLKKLSELLLSAGAIELFPTIKGASPIKNKNEIESIPRALNLKKSSLMTIHLFSSCPIGENKALCVADSYGKVFGQEGLYISDGSMLPTAPGVNPQGSIMAFAYRNIHRIISK